MAARLTSPPQAPWALRLWQLLIAFGRAGSFGFGGGPAFIPLIEREVLAHGWLSHTGFLDALAFGNALPGPITTKLAGYVGYRVAGWPGALVALVGLTVPTILAMIALAALYLRYQETAAVERFLAGLRPVVIALLVLVVVGFAPSALAPSTDRYERAWRWLVALGAFVLAVTLDVHPALLILAGGVLGLLLARRP